MPDRIGVKRSTILDLLALAAIPTILVVIHRLLPSGGQTLAFDYNQLNPLKMWTAGYVHLNDQHLQSNLLGYWVAILPTWILYRTWDRRRNFWMMVCVLGLVGPVLVSLGSYLVFRFGIGTTEAVGRGFSGVVAAIGGLLWASIPYYIDDKYDRKRALQIGETAVLLPLIGLILTEVDNHSYITIGSATLGVALAFLGVFPPRLWSSLSRDQISPEIIVEFLIVGYCLTGVSYILVNLFPNVTAGSGAVTNVYGHLIGLLVGIFIFIITIRRINYS